MRQISEAEAHRITLDAGRHFLRLYKVERARNALLMAALKMKDLGEAAAKASRAMTAFDAAKPGANLL